MTVLYENRQRAKRARLSMLAALVWSVGWFYWANALRSGGARPGAIAIVIAVGLLPLVVLHFYGNVYVVRLVRNGDKVDVTTLGLFGTRQMQVPLSSITEVARPEAGGMTVRVAGRRTPFILDLQAEHSDIAAISALGPQNAARATGPS
ncbi:hypothetical protein [Pseudorhodoplanes sp.]|uniref:hypothetical protein n=1 Tax=Pseudorhodoplanes sp. TaxID=1934341 RepID=UPI002CF287BE|nr:hypothetical protein [Pseudorhodoplanes sp.]HWV41035.1 hypothetical protein [Pseudorhodoplanes sp.]